MNTETSNSGRSSEVKVPIGLTPKKYHDKKVNSERFNDVREAISRYYDAGLKIDIEWIEEYNELIDSLYGA